MQVDFKETCIVYYYQLYYNYACLCLRYYILLSENRYLLFLTENYAALGILKQYLIDNMSSGGVVGDGLISHPYILFGSSFPKDKEYTQVSVCVCIIGGGSVFWPISAYN